MRAVPLGTPLSASSQHGTRSTATGLSVINMVLSTVAADKTGPVPNQRRGGVPFARSVARMGDVSDLPNPPWPSRPMLMAGGIAALAAAGGGRPGPAPP